MKKKLLSLILTLLLIVTLFTGCGGSSVGTKEYAAMDMAAPEEMAQSNSLTSSGSDGSNTLPEGRKWIVTVYMDAETDDLDAMTAALDERIRSLNGYVEDQNVYNGSSYANRRYRHANMTIRIPAEDVDKFTEEVSGIANVVSEETNREDITLSYVATESRLAALETEETRLLELLAKAETMSDLLEIEARLTEVRYELERTASQKRLYDNQIDYATIHLSIEEVQEYTPVEEPTLWERIRDGFRGSLEGLGQSLQNLLVFLVACSPFLVVYGGIILVIVQLVKRIRKNHKSKKEKKDEEQP